MAGKATKKQALANQQALSTLYKASLPLIFVSLLRTWYCNSGKSPLIKIISLHIPCIICIYTLEKTGRPTYDSKGKLSTVGVDLAQSGGLTDIMFDVIYLSLIADVGVILFNTLWLWWICGIAVVGYGGYKLWALKNMLMPSSPKTPKAKSTTPSEPEKSKRQMKREKRGDKVQIKYR
ncbi:hypothetical protein TBLA_0D02420 [Henningerozyma blattae CBS 6284]|uniref:DUF788 domain protein n=1 Tax=Henningerozyma blattae (strain ATCC 34711 / CBS 6284 / DSM 70876 / NBRC 10599 / NRRL Y-10934 / UCD 77-7) TaxID=1071380 RepID=I2H2Z4_HENB6|nr:hypothetical protein TBLA_0D02420 [Tetrapisispora blattae CBS 6284]CCH60746.1 hypothetical protein TBLA_0D02420 [Tetrapisispora blattae CBS 6284]